MPVVGEGGIGTWYYGKRNLVTRKGSCDQCGSWGELRSYDTTLFIVVLFVPLIPLRRYHIIDACPACKKHKRLGRARWEKIKGEGLKTVLEELHAKPSDQETALKAIGTSLGLQDEEAFLGLSAVLEETCADNPTVLAGLAEGYDYFGHHAPAEAAYRKSLEIRPDAAVQDALGVHLLMHGNVDDGWALVAPALESGDPKKIGVLALAAEAYQAAGRHAEALALMERIEAAFPQVAKDKRFAKARKASQRLAASGKPLKSAYVHAKAAKRGRERPWLARAPWLIGPGLALLAFVWYVCAAWWIGGHRLVHVVSGTSRGYTVEIAGRKVSLPAFGHTTVRIPEGTFTVRVTTPGVRVPDQACTVETGFWGRPFSDPVIVINPDAIALLEEEVVQYGVAGTRPTGSSPGARIHAGDLVYRFKDVDYAFEPTPGQIKMPSGTNVVSKTRLDIAQTSGASDRLELVIGELGMTAAAEFAKRAVLADPDELVYANALQVVAPGEAVDLLKPLLGDRPARIAAHRAYQDAVERAEPGRDLTTEYRARLAASPDDAGLKYLLGRAAHDPKVSGPLWREALTDKRAGAFAAAGLAFDLETEGKFAEALAMLDRATRDPAAGPLMEHHREVCLHALGRFDEVLRLGRLARPLGAMTPADFADLLYFTQRATGRKSAEALLDRAMAPEPGRPAAWASVDAYYRAMLGYVDGEERALVELKNAGPDTLSQALAAGDLEKAAKQPNRVRSVGEAGGPLLIAIAATLKGDGALADAQFRRAAEVSEKGKWEYHQIAGWLRGGATPAPGEAAALRLQPEEKCVVLVALGLRFPERREECFELARKLDYDLRPPHLLLKRTLEGAAAPDAGAPVKSPGVPASGLLRRTRRARRARFRRR